MGSQDGDPADYLKKLVKKRDSTARRLTRSAKSLQDGVTMLGDDMAIDAAKIDRDDLEKCFAQFEAVQNEIEEEVSGDELALQEAERERIETLVRQARVSASNFLRRSIVPVHVSSASSNVTPVATTKIKRPEITVPKFSGDVRKWSEFKNVFESLVIDERLYTDVERMIYLKQAVEGKAAEVISNFEISGNNFEKAWEKPRNRYENRRAVISSYLEALCKLPYAKAEADVSSLLDAATDAIESLNSIGIENGWELMLCYLVSSKLDPETRKQWELSIVQEKEYPTFQKLQKFLQQRVRVFEAISLVHCSKASGGSQKKDKPPEKGKVLLTSYRSNVDAHSSTAPSSTAVSSHQSVNSSRACFDCGASSHTLVECKSFLSKSLQEKTQVIQKRGLCFNCLNRGHRVAMCRLKRCEKCGKRHHLLLHPEEVTQSTASEKQPSSSSAALELPAPLQPEKVSEKKTENGHAYLVKPSSGTRVCLPAALVYVFGPEGHRHTVRAFLDSASSINAISERLARKLRCRFEKSSMTLSTLMPGDFTVCNYCIVTVHSRFTAFNFNGKFQVTPLIAKDFASFEKASIEPEFLIDRDLADIPRVNPGQVDLLLGAEFFEEFMLTGKVKVGERAYLRESEFGWVFIGVTDSESIGGASFFDLVAPCFLTLESNFQRFWLVDEVFDAKAAWTEEEKRVDDEYERTWTRISEGNFLLFLPKNLTDEMLGESRSIAFNRLLSLERRLRKNEKVARAYDGFLIEYEDLDHMNQIHSALAFVYLPHHPVFKEGSTTTSTRVVFDAAALTSSGYSLNDFLAKGPVLQEDLFSILLRFRSHRVAFTADIEKMYRQVLIQPSDRKYQCILWRNPKSGLIGTYQLNTVTYGTKPASYLATKCLFKLSELNSEQYPESSLVVKSDFYMDDLLSGADSVDKAKVRIKEVTGILKSGGFPLRKFVASQREVLADLDDSLVVQSRSFEDVEAVSVLGVKWTGYNGDNFVFFNKLSDEDVSSTMSKRLFLSKIFRIYDPLGLLAPVVNSLKFLLQELWRVKLDWDDPVPPHILERFRQMCTELRELSRVSVPRWTGFTSSSEIHVFCDASQKGYGAAVYVRTMTTNGEFLVSLLCAKSRVAPLKVLSIPRLELCAALLGAKLFKKICASLRLPETARVCAWSDSTIVLSWLYFDSGNWNTFVANRVSKIRDVIHPNHWFHVNSGDNAADVVSRGLESGFSQLSDFWTGPSFLREEKEFLRVLDLDPKSLEETKVKSKVFLTLDQADIFLQKFSKYEHLVALVCFVLRFSKKFRAKDYEPGVLSCHERLRAHRILIKRSQGRVIERISKLDSFLDDEGIWRLRGRLGKSELTFESMHPVILPKDRLLLLWIRYLHNLYFHAGIVFLKNLVRTSYYVIGDLNRIIRGVIYNCVVCRRYAKDLHYRPPIGELPTCRVTVSQAFVQVGVDFAGPFQTRVVGPSGNRGKVLFKSYVALFVCMSSRAVHIEVVEDLSTKSFIDAFNRFTARRGLCHTVFSDHGTNFVGANRELRAAFEFLKKHHSEFMAHCSKIGVDWKFIPERAPHFGGLWESAVKSFKFHFKRVVGSQILSFSELTTLSCRIEAILNSRPICTSPDSTSSVITPSHLCIGRAGGVVPPIQGEVVKGIARTRYSLVQSIFERFWTVWRTEYLIALRSAYFRKVGSRQAELDDVVLVKDENLPPAQWKLGRIIRLIPGSDGVTRVVDLVSNGRVFRRPVVKLVPLLPD